MGGTKEPAIRRGFCPYVSEVASGVPGWLPSLGELTEPEAVASSGRSIAESAGRVLTAPQLRPVGSVTVLGEAAAAPGRGRRDKPAGWNPAIPPSSLPPGTRRG